MTLIHKSVSAFGDWIIFMNGRMLYKKWPNGSSMLFEKYGPNTTNADRDNSRTAADVGTEKAEEAMNPFHERDPKAVAAMVSSLLVDICGSANDVIKATALFTVASSAQNWLMDEKLLAYFSFADLRDNLNLKRLIDLNDPAKFPTMPVEVRSPIRQYLYSVPGFRPEMGYKQTAQAFESHAQAEMDLTKLLGSLYDTYDQIFGGAREPLRVADAVYDGSSGVSMPWQSYLTGGEAATGEGAAAETTSPLESVPDDIVAIVDELGYDKRVAYLLLGERMRWQEEIERLRKAADYISPYLRYTIGEESPGHHPTMPSAVAAFHVAFDIDTQEKRMARARASLNLGQD